MSEEPSPFQGRMPERLQGESLFQTLERADLSNVTCIVLSKHFKILQNLPADRRVDARRLSISQTIITSLILPHKSIAAEARHFLSSNRLHALPFIGIHLRQTDFLSWGDHKSFAKECNENPELVFRYIRNVSDIRTSAGTVLVLATDDYISPCSMAVKAEFDTVLTLLAASHFKRGSCEEASFDQEVLGASATFIGDGTSTFSDAIRQIRTTRNKLSYESNILLFA